MKTTTKTPRHKENPGAATGLKEYRRKRDFARTPEPAGTATPAPGGKPLYVIQKHAARREHYDFRLEMNGVLKSWAVPRGRASIPAASGSPSRSRTIRWSMAASKA
jgi:hypothetical protein